MGGHDVIIECPDCGTKYQFDESLLEGKGGWVRCTRCKKIFFHETRREEVTFQFDEIAEGPRIDKAAHFDDEAEFEEELKSFTIQTDEEPPSYGEEEPFEEKKIQINDLAEIPEEGQQPEKKYWTRKKVRVLGLAVVVVLFSVYLWSYPDVLGGLLEKISPALNTKGTVGTATVQQETVRVEGKEIYFTDIEEHKVKNWIVGDVFVIRGNAVNKNEYPVSKIKVRGKVLDSSGGVLMEKESFAGNILTDEELQNLTKDEIQKELSNSYGRDVSNRDIAARGSIPFMIVFCNPTAQASEYLITLSEVNGVASSE